MTNANTIVASIPVCLLGVFDGEGFSLDDQDRIEQEYEASLDRQLQELYGEGVEVHIVSSPQGLVGHCDSHLRHLVTDEMEETAYQEALAAL